MLDYYVRRGIDVKVTVVLDWRALRVSGRED
jgi:hypothetical protein